MTPQKKTEVIFKKNLDTVEVSRIRKIKLHCHTDAD